MFKKFKLREKIMERCLSWNFSVLMVFISAIGGLILADSVPSNWSEGKKSNYVNGGKMEEVVFRVLEGSNSKKTFVRRGELILKKEAPATILIAHGYMCSMRDVSFLRWMFPSFNTFVFDFRAHGERSADQVCTFGHDEAYDVIGAVKFLRSHKEVRDKPIIAYGFSMGAVSIIEAQAKDTSLFSALIVDCPYDSSENVVKRALSNMKFNLFGYEFPLPGRTLLQKYAFHRYVQPFLKMMLKTVAQMDATPINTRIVPVIPLESIKKAVVPIFLIHCKKDEKIPVEAALSLYQNAPSYKRLWLTNGRRHFDSYFNNPEKYAHKVNSFINKVLSKRYINKVQLKITEDSI